MPDYCYAVVRGHTVEKTWTFRVQKDILCNGKTRTTTSAITSQQLWCCYHSFVHGSRQRSKNLCNCRTLKLYHMFSVIVVVVDVVHKRPAHSTWMRNRIRKIPWNCRKRPFCLVDSRRWRLTYTTRRCGATSPHWRYRIIRNPRMIHKPRCRMIRGRHSRKRSFPFLCIVWCRASSQPMVTMEMRMLSVEQRQITNNSLHCWCAACVYQRCRYRVMGKHRIADGNTSLRNRCADWFRSPSPIFPAPKTPLCTSTANTIFPQTNFPIRCSAFRMSNTIFYTSPTDRVEYNGISNSTQHIRSESTFVADRSKCTRISPDTKIFIQKEKSKTKNCVCIQPKLIVVFILETFHLHIVVRRTNARVFYTILRSVSIRMWTQTRDTRIKFKSNTFQVHQKHFFFSDVNSRTNIKSEEKFLDKNSSHGSDCDFIERWCKMYVWNGVCYFLPKGTIVMSHKLNFFFFSFFSVFDNSLRHSEVQD